MEEMIKKHWFKFAVALVCFNFVGSMIGLYCAGPRGASTASGISAVILGITAIALSFLKAMSYLKDNAGGRFFRAAGGLLIGLAWLSGGIILLFGWL